jgi:ATP-dependent exoDNAse (exonuclease V) beta subunit
VWWDPHALRLDVDSGYGLRRDDLISKDGEPARVAERLSAYKQWRADRDAATTRARVPSVRVRTATSIAADRVPDRALEIPTATSEAPRIEVIDFARSTERPFGPRFGTLVHATLATVPLDAAERIIAAVARAQGRILPTEGREPYADEEVYAAVEVVSSLLKDPLFDRVRAAERAGRCDRELPIVWKAADGTLIEGTIDLAFEDLAGLTVVDFKTDRELATDLERYKRQLTVYCQALGRLRQTTARGILARV